MYGASTQTADELATLARSWAQPPILKISGTHFINKGYDLTQRAYIVECADNNADRLEMELVASNESPAVNVCFVVKGWNSENISVLLDGRVLNAKSEYKSGVIRNLESDNLILWIAMKSSQTMKIVVNRSNI